MAQYDTIIKHLIDRFSAEFAGFALDMPEVAALEKLNTEQSTFKMHHTDVTLKIQLPEAVAILHIEAQTDDSREQPMPLRVLAYASLLMLQHEIPVYSVVLYFRPPAAQNDPGYLGSERGTEFGIKIKDKVIRLYALAGEPLLDAKAIGLLPFMPLMKVPACMSAQGWVRKCVDAVHATPIDKTTRATLLFAYRFSAVSCIPLNFSHN